MKEDKLLWPEPPIFSKEIFEKCTKKKDFRIILFELYKYIGLISNITSCISFKSQSLRKMDSVYYGTLTGLLNRCSRLMLANMRLSCTRHYGETTRLIDRCISESAIKVIWLCASDNAEFFKRYIADGLKKDLMLKNIIEKNITDRGGDILPIEKRMLDSVDRCISLSGLDESQILETPKLHDLATIFNDIGIDQMMYLAMQKLGSHAIHGTWTDLVMNYLNYDEEVGFYPRDHEIDTQDVQFILIIRLMINAIENFLKYVVDDSSMVEDEINVLNKMLDFIVLIQKQTWESDFTYNI